MSGQKSLAESWDLQHHVVDNVRFLRAGRQELWIYLEGRVTGFDSLLVAPQFVQHNRLTMIRDCRLRI